MTTATSLRLDLGVIATLEFGLFPSHWNIRPLGRCVRFVGGMTPSREVTAYWGNGLPWVSAKDMKRPLISGAEESITARAAKETGIPVVPPRSVLIVVRGMILARTTPIALTTVPVAVNQDMKALVPLDDIDPSFLRYALQARQDQIASMIDEAGHGTKRLPIYPLRKLNIPVPPLDEQCLIVRYLDHHGRKVNTFIRAKRRLIDLLTEQKQAIVYQAVTCGLDSNVPFKPSGVAWIGDVPEHWSVAPLRLRYTVDLGKMLDTHQMHRTALVPYLRNADVQWGRINTVDLPLMDVEADEYDRYTVKRGDLLVCEGGEVGRSAIWESGLTPVGFQKALHRLRPIASDRDEPRFLYFVLRSATALGVFAAQGNESTIVHLTNEKLRAHRFAFPPSDEQRAIVEYLTGQLSEIDSLRDGARRQIELVNEYRTRLIADVVLGKVDVRDAALRLPAVEPLGDELDAFLLGDHENVNAVEGSEDG